jgi:DNA-binding transcriptional ArsR family regulator
MHRMPNTDVFTAIANPVRRRILELLRDGPRPAGSLVEEFQVNRPAISEHLQLLRLAGLVVEEAQGRQRIYSLKPGALDEVTRWLHPFETYWQQRFAALRRTLDEESS